MTRFIKQLQASLATRSGTDIYGAATYNAPTPVWLAVIHLNAAKLPTSVRADSSASRGRTEEAAPAGKVLMERTTNPKIEDRLVVLGTNYLISAAEPRFGVTGGLDHWEITLAPSAG